MTAWIRPDDLVVAGEPWTALSRRRPLDGDGCPGQLQVREPLGTVSAEGAPSTGEAATVASGAVEDAGSSPLDRLGQGAVRGEARLPRTALEGVSLRARGRRGH